MVSRARRLPRRAGTADKFIGGPVLFGSMALTIQNLWRLNDFF
jgi:hypothetical protein